MPGLSTQLRNNLAALACIAGVLAIAVCYARPVLLGQTEQSSPSEPVANDAITVSGFVSHEWTEQGVRIAVLRGQCRVVQGDTVMSARKMVLWQADGTDGHGKSEQLVVYLEEDARLERPGRTWNRGSMMLNLDSKTEIKYQIRNRLTDQPADSDPLYQRAAARQQAGKRNKLRQTQYVVSQSQPSGPELKVPDTLPQQGGVRRVRIYQRSAVPFNVESFKSEKTTPPEQISILTGGVVLLIDGIEEYGTIDLAADRIIIWSQPGMNDGFDSGAETVQSRETPFQVYLEGNIVIRQGKNVIRAKRAFYDAKEDRALVLDADLKTPIPNLPGNLRVRAERLWQKSQDNFHAQNAWATASQFGKPGYRLQATDIFLENRYVVPWIGAGNSEIDPITGAPIVETTPWFTSINNAFFVENLPLFYTPYLSGPAEDPHIPLRRATIKQDRIFGFQVKTIWDVQQILGIDSAKGVRWDLYADYLSDRGPAIGTGGRYQGTNLFGMPGSYSGESLLYYINDGGDDNLGARRRDLPPEDISRGRVLWRHRQDLPNEVTLLGEIGYLSDRNFLEQYYENEFDQDEDNETLLYLKQDVENWAWSVMGRPQLNDFSTTTEWLPRGDLYGLSEPLFNSLLTWSSHTSAGYGRLRPADAPSDPNDVFTPLPFVSNSEGAVLMSRHELDMPFSLGPVNFVPYVLGEAAFWSEGFQGEEIDRLVGSVGIRSSVMFWRAFPYVHSRFFNLNGLAHKMLFEAEYAYTDSSENLANIPQYNEFDDNAQERFRNRLVTNTFRGMVPPQFEPRFYAVRTGAGRAVTAPYHELVDDQQVVRLAWRHRLQTKAGPPERLRIKDWMTLDLEASFFPDADQDNFGEDVGLLGARYRWDVGDRTTLLANAYYDLFDSAQQLWNVGLLSQRSSRGSVYVGIRQIKGANLDSQIFSASASYTMSPKWIGTIGTAYDIGENRNAGQSVTLTRVGKDFLIHLGASFDASKDNAGIAVSIEPRLAPLGSPPSQLGSLLGGGGKRQR